MFRTLTDVQTEVSRTAMDFLVDEYVEYSHNLRSECCDSRKRKLKVLCVLSEEQDGTAESALSIHSQRSR